MAGGVQFLSGLLAAELASEVPRVTALLGTISRLAGDRFTELSEAERAAVLDQLVEDTDYQWFSRLVQHGFYADPENGGNLDRASWRMLDWSPEPAGGWPSVLPEDDRSAVIRRDQLQSRYDVIIVGSGAGGGVAAQQLTAAGRRVLVVERGDFPTTGYLAQDHLRNARTDTGLDHRTLPSSEQNPRTLLLGKESIPLRAPDGRWGSNAYTLGGGTRVYGAQAWRFGPEDFTMASTYGVPEGSALADWPFTYEELEPYYTKAEWEIGVCGETAGDAYNPQRSRPHPMPPMPMTRPGAVLAEGAQKIGLSTFAAPLAINSVDYAGRAACVRCSQCPGFACPVGAKAGSVNTTLRRAAATGQLSIITGTRAERVITDRTGRVCGVALIGDIGGSLWRATVEADAVVVSAGAVESARLLLNSSSDREPYGLGNNHDQVGRYLQGHLYTGALGLFDEPVNDYVGPGVIIATNDFRHHNEGYVGGGMIANEFVPTPVSVYDYLLGAGLIGRHGVGVKQDMTRMIARLQRVVGPIQEVTSAESRVRLDPKITDSYGIPVAQLSGTLHEEDHRIQAFLGSKAEEWLRASGATTVIGGGRRPDSAGPSSGQHQAGSLRMGDDPARSAVDPLGRVWGHDNLYVVDGSVHVTNGGVNPVLTIFATAYRTMDLWLRS